VYLWWISGKWIYFNIVWYRSEFCKNANIWYIFFSWCSLIFLATYFWRLTLLYSVSAEANCFLKFIVFIFLSHWRHQLWESAFAEVEEGLCSMNWRWQHVYTSVDAMNWRWQHMSVDAANLVHFCALCIWFSYFV